MSNDESKALDAVTKGLINHLVDEMPNVEDIKEGWPAANESLDYPTITVFMKSPQVSLFAPHTIGKTDATAPEKSKVLRAYGYYNLSMQVDLWAEYRPQLKTMIEDFVKLFNPSLERTGISLRLDNYFNQSVTYTLTEINIIEGEQGSQRNEWRAVATVLTGCRAIKEHLETLIDNIENNIEITDDIEEESEDYFSIV